MTCFLAFCFWLKYSCKVYVLYSILVLLHVHVVPRIVVVHTTFGVVESTVTFLICACDLWLLWSVPTYYCGLWLVWSRDLWLVLRSVRACTNRSVPVICSGLWSVGVWEHGPVIFACEVHVQLDLFAAAHPCQLDYVSMIAVCASPIWPPWPQCTCTARIKLPFHYRQIVIVSGCRIRVARTDLRPATSVSERGASGSVSIKK